MTGYATTISNGEASGESAVATVALRVDDDTPELARRKRNPKPSVRLGYSVPVTLELSNPS